ncbi:MAG: TetR/AcrR family transcriptional regulator [Pseudomonadota bacterium]|nr:TetR/AcrR family transcriptional regulator [Pseudomonadota bacterium]
MAQTKPSIAAKRSKPTPTAESRSPPQAAQPRRRARGRPAAGGDPDLREHLLDAAIQRFSRNGVAATSLRAIAGDAHATPAMLHYYFGDKPQLLDALVAERLLPVVAAIHAPLLDGETTDAPALVRTFVQSMMRIIEANPWLPSLWVREVLNEDGAFRDVLVETVGPKVPRLLAMRLHAMRDAGQWPPGVEPNLLVGSVIGLTMFAAASAPLWSRIFDAPLTTAQIERHALALLDAAMRPSNPAQEQSA